MSCEICGDETGSVSSGEPLDESGYIIWVTTSETGGSHGLDKQEFKFCSLEHAEMFIPE